MLNTIREVDKGERSKGESEDVGRYREKNKASSLVKSRKKEEERDSLSQ